MEEQKPKRTFAQRCGDAVDVTVGGVRVLFDGRAYLVLAAFALGFAANTQVSHDLCAKLWALAMAWVHK
jgi:hypothetical protein